MMSNEIILDLELVRQYLGEEFPNTLFLSNRNITSIDWSSSLNYQKAELSDNNTTNTKSKTKSNKGIDVSLDLANLRKLDISFNRLGHLYSITNKLPQLRQLYAFCCHLETINDFNRICDSSSGSTRLEVLYLQQNGIQEIPIGFQTLTKLKDLRLDNNRITEINNLQSCAQLQKLDLSSNLIESVFGLQGLQNLEILNLSYNRITSLKPLRSLPNLKELNISNNSLSKLDGIQLIPSLRSVDASNNEIITLRIPQTYTHRSQSDKSNTNNSNKTTASNSRNSKDYIEVVGMPNLFEIDFAHNQLQSLDGIDSLGTHLESLNLTRNNFHDLSSFIKEFQQNISLSCIQELQLDGNPCLEYATEEDIRHVIAQLMESSPLLHAFNEYDIVLTDNQVSSTTTNENESIVNTKDKFVLENKDFHTWNTEDIESEDLLDKVSVSDDHSYRLKARTSEKTSDSDIKTSLNDIKSAEEILILESEIRDIIAGCKDTLNNIRDLPINSEVSYQRLSSFYSRELQKKESELRQVTSSQVVQQGVLIDNDVLVNDVLVNDILVNDIDDLIEISTSSNSSNDKHLVAEEISRLASNKSIKENQRPLSARHTSTSSISTSQTFEQDNRPSTAGAFSKSTFSIGFDFRKSINKPINRKDFTS